MKHFSLEIPNITHQWEYERTMTRWEQMEENIQPELMRRYSQKLHGNIPFQKWLEYCEDDRTTGSMLSTHIPCTLFFLVDGEKHISGSIVLNHADTKRGHLHAGIAPWCRGKGYGTVMLSLALMECQKRGIWKVHICPNSKYNLSAIRTIVKNGGYLLEQSAQDGFEIPRYEIDLLTHPYETALQL